MCGRFVLPTEAVVSRILNIDRWNWHWPEQRYNVAPTTRELMVFRADDALLELNGARWGFIPHWWKKDAPPSLTFNARPEEAAEKPTWHHSLRRLRCLMPVRGRYEWNEKEQVRNDSDLKVKQPYFISSPDSEVIVFAGLWLSGRTKMAPRCFPAHYCPKQHRQLLSTSMTACPSFSNRSTSMPGWIRKHMARPSKRSSPTHIRILSAIL